MNMHILAWKLFMHIVNYYSFILVWKVEMRYHLCVEKLVEYVHDLVYHLTRCHAEEFMEHLHHLISRSRCVQSKSGCYFNGPITAWPRCVWSLRFLIWKNWLSVPKSLAICHGNKSHLLILFLQLWSDGSHSIHWWFSWAMKASVFLSSVLAFSSIVSKSKRLTVNYVQQSGYS